MSSKASTTAIGGFVLGAMTLFAAAVIYFGTGHYGEEIVKAVLYFDGSLKGLNVGAPVLFRGVKVGEVKKIVVRYNPDNQEMVIPVFIDLYPTNVERVDGKQGNPAKAIELMIEKGMRAKLEMQSFVTGMLNISLDLYPDEPPRYVRGGDSEMEIPTIPSMMEELTRTLQNLPLEELATDLKLAINAIEDLARSEQLSSAIDSIDLTLQDFSNLARNIDDQVEPVAESLKKTLVDTQDVLALAENELPTVTERLNPMLEEFTEVGKKINENVDPVVERMEQIATSLEDALNQATATLKQAETLIQEDGEMYFEVVNAIRELKAAARSIRFLADYLERHPDALLRGKQAPGGQP